MNTPNRATDKAPVILSIPQDNDSDKLDSVKKNFPAYRYASWRQILIQENIEEQTHDAARGLSAFAETFQRLNSSLGASKLNLLEFFPESDTVPNEGSLLFLLLRQILTTDPQTGQMADSRYPPLFGRQLAMLGKQYRLRLLFDVLLQTLTVVLGQQDRDGDREEARDEEGEGGEGGEGEGGEGGGGGGGGEGGGLVLAAWRFHFDSIYRWIDDMTSPAAR